MCAPARLVIGRAADDVRRAVGPTAWAALEVLTARSARAEEEQRVTASVRQVASALGLSKNAAHRAIRRLVEARLAVPAQPRAIDGRYVTGVYRLTIPADVLRVEAASDRATAIEATPRPRPPCRPRRDDRGIQLELLTDAG